MLPHPPSRSGFCLSVLSRIPKHRKEVTRGARNHEQMPGQMAVADFVRREECDTTRIGKATGEQPDDSGEWNVRKHWFCRDHYTPTHCDVQCDRKKGILRAGNRLHCYTDDGQRPHEPEERPAPWTTHDPQSERSVGSADQKKDRAVVQNPKNLFGFVMSYGVIES